MAQSALNPLLGLAHPQSISTTAPFCPYFLPPVFAKPPYWLNLASLGPSYLDGSTAQLCWRMSLRQPSTSCAVADMPYITISTALGQHMGDALAQGHS